MSGVLAWIVAVERHAPLPGSAANALLDFKAPVSLRALQWAEWLRQQAGTRLLLNLAVAPASPQSQQLDALRGHALNGADAHRADAPALQAALQIVKAAPLEDTLLLLWLGHGVTINRRRFLLHQDSADASNLQSWDVESLLQHLRSGPSPGLQIGVFDTCAQVVDVMPNNQQFGGAGKAQRRQHFFFSATTAALASLNPFEPTLTSMALDVMKTLPWPPQPAPLNDALQAKMSALPSMPVAWEWTHGSGEQWSSRASAAPDETVIAARVRAAGVSDAEFRHLWRTLSPAQLAPTDLVKALKQQRVKALASRLQPQWPDAADALRDAWARVQRAQPWVQPLAELNLALPHWAELAQQACSDDARSSASVPRFTELRELLLWTLDMGGTRGERALLRLMMLAAKEAERTVAGSAPAVAVLRARWHADAVLAPLVAPVDAGAQLQQRPLVLLIELQLPPNRTEPVVDGYWLLRDAAIEPRKKMRLKGTIGMQLNTLINHVLDTHPQPLRVELLAPSELLAGKREWLSYSFDETPGPADNGVGLDTLVPICWRWRDRMRGQDARCQPALWRLRAREAKARVDDSTSLQCLFDGDPPGAAPADVLGLAYHPPGPAEAGPRRSQFLQSVARGHPYMVWPATEPADLAALKTLVTSWLAGQKLIHLPENYRDARSGGQLPHLVLFVDEPHRNPYPLLGRLRSVAPAP